MKTATPTDLQATLEALLVPGLHKPGSLSIDKTVDGPFQLFQVHVDQSDMGRIIGKRGSNLEALRILMTVAGAAQGTVVKIIVPEVMAPARAVWAGPRWSLDLVKAGINAFFTAATLPIVATITTRPDRPDQATVFLTGRPEEETEAALERWLNVMGSPGATRILLDDTDAV